MIDWSRIDELKSDFGQDGLADLLPIFQDEIQEAIAKIETQADAPSIMETAHFIKGSAANLGLSDLTTLCHDIEIAAKSGNVLTKEKSELRQKFDASMEQLLAQI